MIDQISVFNHGGIVLWEKQYQSVPADVINSLVARVFIEETGSAGGGSGFVAGKYTAQYTSDNDLGIHTVVVYQSVLQLGFAKDLARDVQKIFASMYTALDVAQQRLPEVGKFAAMVELLREKAEATGRREESVIGPVAPEQPALQIPEPVDSAKATPETTDDERKGPRKSRRGRKGAAKKDDAPTPKNKKKMRKWGEDGSAEFDRGDEPSALDFSSSKDAEASGDGTVAGVDEEDLAGYGRTSKGGEFVLSELTSELDNILAESDAKDAAAQGSGAGGSGAFGFLRNYVGGKTITADDLDNALTAMERHLLAKNVAKEVADHLCGVVRKSLVGAKTQSWTTVQATVRTAMTDALRRILTPSTSLDLLHEVQKNRARGSRPYVISVVGVNGVGKSTNLSKIAFWLLQNKYKVLIAAGDTFRSGAVEQLKVHVKRLDDLTKRLGAGEIAIYDQGYGKDAAVIAQRAIEHGANNGFDVVLIDTAGRRHNDERLMSSLEKFGKVANPDKIIMVGEALVGTDSVQQARNFNNAFGPSRDLDFFLISKCDTVGDMIGSMVNMTYSTGIPVLFVGIGQNYTDLRTLSVEWAVNLLMS